jgi:hypothetical protein
VFKKFPDGEFCPLVRDSCVRHQCAWFMKVVGMDPQSGQPVDKFGCAVSWLPILTVENSQQQRQTAASVDKVAGQLHKHRRDFLAALTLEAQERVIHSPPLLEGANGAS